MKKRGPSISNLSILNQYYSSLFFSTFEILLYLFSTVTIVMTMIELLGQSDKYLYYGVIIFILYMLQGFYGFLNNDLYKLHSAKMCLFMKLFFLEHLSILYNRRCALFQQAANQIYTSIVSSSFFQGRVLSVICIYLMSFYALQSNQLDSLYQLSIAATSLNVGLYNPMFYIGDDTCSEDAIHYTIEVYARAAFYSVLFLINKESYDFSNNSTIIDFFVLFFLISCFITLLQFLYNLFIKKIPIVDCVVGSCHLMINCVYLRAPSNIAVHRHRLFFMNSSSYIINPQIVVLSAIHRLAECFWFFFMYYKYLDQVPNSSNSINNQIRISQVGSAIYAYILSFQILYVMVASLTNLRESPDDLILKETIDIKELYMKHVPVTTNIYATPRQKQSNPTHPKDSNDNTLAPIYENDKNIKTTKDSQRNTTSTYTTGQKTNKKKPSIFGQYEAGNAEIVINNSPPSSTNNGSIIYQKDFEENQGFQALKIFSPMINKKVNMSPNLSN